MNSPRADTAESVRWYSDYVNGPYTRDLRGLQFFGFVSFIFCLQEMVVGSVESLDLLNRLHLTLLGGLLGCIKSILPSIPYTTDLGLPRQSSTVSHTVL